MSIISLLDLSLEIRLKIYVHLLSDEYVFCLHPKDRRPRSCYNTSLFLVNKQISSETLHYFYSHNAFVAIELNAPSYLHDFSRAIPIFHKGVRSQCNNYALKIRYRMVDSSHEMWDRQEDIGEYAMLAGRHLPNLIQLLNAEHFSFSIYDPKISIDLEFSSKRGYFNGTARKTAMLANGMKGLRCLFPYTDFLGASSNPNDIFTGHPIVFHIHGSISPEQTEDLLSFTNLPILGPQGNIAEIEACQNRGSMYRYANDYPNARGEYEMAYLTANHYKVEVEWTGNLELLLRLQLLVIQNDIRMSELWSVTKQHSQAVEYARSAWARCQQIRSYGYFAIPMIERASIQTRLGDALVAGGAYDLAVQSYECACSLFTGSSMLEEKLALAKNMAGKSRCVIDEDLRIVQP